MGSGLYKISRKDFKVLFDQKALMGEAYYVRDFLTMGVEVTYNTLTCPVDKYVFFESGADASEETVFVAYENSIFTDLITIGAFNTRRGLPDSLSEGIILGVTNLANIVDIGDIYIRGKAPPGHNPTASAGGDINLPTPVILEPGGKYIFETDSKTADNVFNTSARIFAMKL